MSNQNLVRKREGTVAYSLKRVSLCQDRATTPANGCKQHISDVFLYTSIVENLIYPL